MVQRGPPHSATQRHQRELLILPHKNISIKTFFNEKVSPIQSKRIYVHCSNSSFRNQNMLQSRYKPANPIAKTKYTNQSFAETPKHKAGSYFISTSSGRLADRLRRRSLFATATAKSELTRPEHSHSTSAAKNQLLDHSGIEMTRKQLELKFSRTRIILKQEQKMQKYDKIQKIYENKFKQRPRGKISRTDSRESHQLCSPWNRRAQGYDTIHEMEPKFVSN